MFLSPTLRCILATLIQAAILFTREHHASTPLHTGGLVGSQNSLNGLDSLRVRQFPVTIDVFVLGRCSYDVYEVRHELAFECSARFAD